MRSHFTVRALVYGLAVVTGAAVVFLGFAIYRNGVTVPFAVLNWSVAQRLAARYGAHYSLDSLRIGCLKKSCPGDVNAGTLKVEFNTAEPFRLQLNGAQWRRSAPITVPGLEIRSGDRPPLLALETLSANFSSSQVAVTGLRVGLSPGAPPAEIERVEFDGAAKRVAVNRIQVKRAGRPPLIVERVQFEGWELPASDPEIVLSHVEVAGVMLSLDGGRTSSATLCEELPFNSAIGREAIAPFLPLLPLFSESVLKLRADLLRVALALGGFILILKFLSVLWLKRWWARLLVTPIPIVLAFALYFGRPEAWTIGRLVLVVAATVAGVAVALRLLVYRRGEKWYQRWEPFAADLASIVLLFPLLGYGYQLPARPSPPQKFRIERLDIANLAGRSERGVRFDLPQAAVIGTRISLPDSVRQVVELAISAIEIPTAAVTVSPSSHLTLDETRVDGVIATYDSQRMEVRDLYAHVRLAGLFESDVLQRELRNLEFLRGMETRPSRVGFDVDLTAAGPGAAPQVPQQFAQSRNPIGVNATVALNPVDCTASYDLLARILTPSLKLSARADGDARYVHLRDLHSLPESSVAIASGSGKVTLGSPTSMSFNFGTIGGQVGQAQLALSSLGIAASLPQSGKQELSFALGPAEIQTSEGLQIRFAQAGMRMDREPNSSMIPLTFQSRIEDVRLNRQNNGVIEADFPLLESTIKGNTTPELIPNTFNGTASFKMSGAGSTGELLGLEQPLSLALDLWKGRLELIEQPVALRGVLLPEAISSIPIRAQLSGQLSHIEPQLKASLQAHANIGPIDQALGSGRVTMDGIRFDGNADWDDRGVSAKLNYATGWIEAQLAPPPPFALCLDEISTLDLTVQGKASRIPFGGSETTTTSTTAPSTCASLAAASREARFRVSGVYPPSPQESVFRLENASGKGIRVGNVGSELRLLRIREGRLGETASRISATGIQNLQGLGGFDALVDLRRGGESLEATSSILAGGGRLLAAAVTRSPDRITLDVMQDAPADQILDRLGPFLSDLNLSLDGITPQGRIARLHAEANFAGDALEDLSATAELAGGPIVSISRPDVRVNVSTPSTGSGPTFRFNIGKPQQVGTSRSIAAVVDLPGSLINATTNDGVALELESKLRLDVRGSFLETARPPASPILEKLVEVGNGLNREVSRLAGILGSENEPAASPVSNIDWKLSLSQRSPAQPLVRFTPNAIQVEGPRVSFNAGWAARDGGDVQERSTIAGSSALDTTIALDGDQVLVDALPSVQLTAALNGEPETRFETTLPIQVAFSERLREASLQSDSLWDADYYANFWRAHPSKFAGTEIIAPLDIGEATVGGLSIRQVLFPVEPIRALVGYSNALQLGLPFSGRALFGAVGGTLESNLTSQTDTAALDLRLKIDLKSIQMGALGTSMGGGHSAFVEDELDGKTSLRLDGLTLDRNTIAALVAGNPDPDELRKIGLSIYLVRTPETASLPAVLQASTDVEIDLANELLNRIVNGFQLTGPPRALTYSDLEVKFDVERGLVRSDGAILQLGGLQILSTDRVDVVGKVRAHLGGPGERILLRDMIQMLSGLTPAAEAEVR